MASHNIYLNYNNNFFEFINKVIFEGKYLDENPSRYRPLSHLTEITDIYIRNFFFNSISHSIFFNTTSNYFVFLFSIFFLFKIFTKLINDKYLVFFIILVLISSTAYQPTGLNLELQTPF